MKKRLHPALVHAHAHARHVGYLRIGIGIGLGLVLVFKTSRYTLPPHAAHANEHGSALARVLHGVLVRASVGLSRDREFGSRPVHCRVAGQFSLPSLRGR